MLRVRVSKVTSDYLKEQGIEPGVWYDAYPDGEDASFVFPAPGQREFILLSGGCAHLEDNEQTEWEVSDA